MMRTYIRETRHLFLNGRKLRMLLFRPVRSSRSVEETAGVLWLHGGGFVTGMPEMVYLTRALSLVERHGAVLLAPDYRLSGEAPYPAALEDCWAALLYLRDHAEELGFSPARLVVGGESAGGGLTAALCMLARDRGEVRIALQLPLYPMLDDRDTDTSRDNHAPVWNTRRNHAAWAKYLGRLYGTDRVPPYAAPARQTDYHGLPPAYTFVGTLEPFYRETLTYVENLRRAGVPAALDVYPNWYHGYDIVQPFHRRSRLAGKRFERAFEKGLLIVNNL